uniref:Very-long-chain (3R)-3-hydroxyacyl-CoA dehydratase n=1 Tax=Echeneis naucrates TaxID=173247 RepID=A0A665UVY1_ECHNA
MKVNLLNINFCGHTWILANTIARYFTFGRDALADTFYSVGLVMSLCQLLSILELFHIADGIEKNLLLVLVILLEEIQGKPVVCVQFFLWNILDLLRYPHELLCLMDTPSTAMLWTRYTLWIPLYVLSVATEGDWLIRQKSTHGWRSECECEWLLVYTPPSPSVSWD